MREVMWLCNTARKILRYHNLGLYVNAVISVPDQNKTLFVRYMFSKDGNIAIRFEQYSLPLHIDSFATLEKAKRQLIDLYHLKDIIEDGGVWTLEDLIQVQGAFRKLLLRPYDMNVLILRFPRASVRLATRKMLCS